jgi:nucleoside-diphosphate-sugar epimerase
MRVKDIYDIFHGGPIPEFSPIRSTFVDVRDVAELVLRAVERDDKTPGARERYLLVGQSPISPQGMADVLRARFPERRDKIQEGNPGETYPDMAWGFDAGKAGTLLGRDWIGFERSVVDSTKVFLGAESAEELISLRGSQVEHGGGRD